MSALSRRDLLAATAASALLRACRSDRRDVVRVGFMTNLTHAPVIAGLASGRLERALGVRVEARSFRAGPRVLEALVGDAIDVGSAGPSAIVYTNARHAAGTLRLLSRLSARVARRSSCGRLAGSAGPRTCEGKTLATRQVWGRRRTSRCASTCARTATRPPSAGVTSRVHGARRDDDPRRDCVRGALDGAWLAEPWATRVVREAAAVRLVDERDLWPERRFPTAVLVARGDWARAQPARADTLSTVVADEVGRAVQAPEATRAVVGDELARLLGKRLKDDLLAEAWGRVDFTSDPMTPALDTIAEDAFTLGLAPRSSSKTLLG